MDLAAKQLRESNNAIVSIATNIGYESETAFSKAFRKNRGIAPGQYRTQMCASGE